MSFVEPRQRGTWPVVASPSTNANRPNANASPSPQGRAAMPGAVGRTGSSPPRQKHIQSAAHSETRPAQPSGSPVESDQDLEHNQYKYWWRKLKEDATYDTLQAIRDDADSLINDHNRPILYKRAREMAKEKRSYKVRGKSGIVPAVSLEAIICEIDRRLAGLSGLRRAVQAESIATWNQKQLREAAYFWFLLIKEAGKEVHEAFIARLKGESAQLQPVLRGSLGLSRLHLVLATPGEPGDRAPKSKRWHAGYMWDP